MKIAPLLILAGLGYLAHKAFANPRSARHGTLDGRTGTGVPTGRLVIDSANWTDGENYSVDVMDLVALGFNPTQGVLDITPDITWGGDVDSPPLSLWLTYHYEGSEPISIIVRENQHLILPIGA